MLESSRRSAAGLAAAGLSDPMTRIADANGR